MDRGMLPCSLGNDSNGVSPIYSMCYWSYSVSVCSSLFLKLTVWKRDFTIYNTNCCQCIQYQVLRQSQGAGRPRHPCCRTHCGSPVSQPAASSPASSRAECPQRWSPSSLCWGGSLCVPRWEPADKMTPVCEAKSKGPVAAAGEAREDVHNSPSTLREGRLCPLHIWPRCP